MADIEERKYWKQYMNAYEHCLGATSTRHAPWYIVPADDKHDARLMFLGLRFVFPNLNVSGGWENLKRCYQILGWTPFDAQELRVKIPNKVGLDVQRNPLVWALPLQALLLLSNLDLLDPWSDEWFTLTNVPQPLSQVVSTDPMTSAALLRAAALLDSTPLDGKSAG